MSNQSVVFLKITENDYYKNGKRHLHFEVHII